MTNLPLKTDGYLVLLLVLLCSCASPIRNMSHQELLDSKDDFVARYQDDLVLISTKSAARLRQEYVNSTAVKWAPLVLVFYMVGEK